MPAARRRRSALLAGAALAAAALAGCGQARTAPPDVATIAPPARTESARFPAAQLDLQAPSNWHRSTGARPLVVSYVSGPAVVAVWRYPRTEPLPVTPRALGRARTALIGQVRRRDAGARVLSSAVRRGSAGVNEIELVADETIAGQPRRVRSVHLFADGAEVVVDAFAPGADFDRVDRAVFQPLVHSVRVGGIPAP